MGVGFYHLGHQLARSVERAGYVQFLGRSSSSEWDISGEHMAERCGLLVIIALGESLLVSGSTFAGLDWNTATVAAFISAFVATVAMWWIYFNLAAERASETVGEAENTGKIGRLVYTYVHFVIIAGIVIIAAADEFVLALRWGKRRRKSCGRWSAVQLSIWSAISCSNG